MIDDEDCEVEGDLLGIVSQVILVMVNFMIKYVCGLFCVLVSEVIVK